MNIFYLSKHPRVCAEMHNDKHVVKMILEYAQLLSTAHRVIDGELVTGLSKSGRKQTRYVLSDNRDDMLYAATHINHPSGVWTRQSDQNYDWLYTVWRELMTEYTYRYGKVHASERLDSLLKIRPTQIKVGEFTEPTPAMPDEYKVAGDSIQSYHNYYIGSKAKMSRWTNRVMPNWFAEGINTKYGHSCYMFTNKQGKIISTSTDNI